MISNTDHNSTEGSESWPELYIKATYLYDTNQYQDAGTYYAKMLQQNPGDIIALTMLAVISYKIGDLISANTLSAAAYRICPQLGVIRHLLRLIKNKPETTVTQEPYSGILDKGFVKRLYQQYLPELSMASVYQDKNRFQDNMTKHIDYDFLYFMIRLFKPRHMIEFSPYHGLSTAFIYTALEANKQDYTFATFDLEEFEGFTERMRQHNIPLNVIAGDAITRIPEYLQDNNLIGRIDFCFVDSEHTYEFAERYTKAVFPLLADNCVIMFHDMCYCPERIEEPFNHYGPVKASEITGHCNSYGEGAYLSKFFRNLKGYRFFLTHRLFGGFGLLSPKLPINQELVDELTSKVEGFRYKLGSSPNNEDRRITCMLIAIPEAICNALETQAI